MKAFVQHQYKDSDKLVIQALIPFAELNKRAIFTQKVLSNDVVSDRSLMDVEGNADYYQRRLNPIRLKEIKKYIFNAILDEKENVAVSALFPTAMILAIEYEEPLPVNDGCVDLVFQDRQKVFIVDGQHRLMAMRQLYEELSSRKLFFDEDEEYILDYLLNYKFNCTILINYDIWEQGQVFVNVNFKQKPVSRSLYYDVYGAEYVEGDNPKNLVRNKIYLAHELTRFMNEQDGSPFYHRIRMLGTGKGYVSQAFFVEALLPLFKDSGVWRFDSMRREDAWKMLLWAKSELYNFFASVATNFKKYWGEDEYGRVNFICKTTGVGAFIRIMALLHWQISDSVLTELGNTLPGAKCTSYCTEIDKYLAPIVEKQDELFGKDSQYGGTGGRGLETALYKRLLSILRASFVLEESDEKTDNMFISSVTSSLSENYLRELRQYGIQEVDSELEKYMIRHLPLELDALGTHSRVDEVLDLEVVQVQTVNEEGQLIINGTFLCVAEIQYGSGSDDTFLKSRFPASFQLCYLRKNEGWVVEDEKSKVYVNTESFYK